MEAKFDFYEIVRIKKDISLPQKLYGKEGTVLGKVQDNNGIWYYSVSMPIDENLCWDFKESQLEKTGKHQKRSDYYNGDSMKVKVDPETDEGYIE